MIEFYLVALETLPLTQKTPLKQGLLLIQDKLEQLLKTTILPQTPFEIDTRWSGIMGVGSQKKPIIKQIHPNVYCGVRLGGMGVAIGSTIGKELAVLSSKKQPGSFLN